MTAWRHQRRPLGTTGVHVTRIGFGAAPLGNLFAPVTDAEAHDCVDAALHAGIDYIDTAPFYGFGLAERRVGDALGDRAPVLSTKVGRSLEPIADARRTSAYGFVDADPFRPVFDYGGDAAERSLGESLRRLRRDRIDIVFVHDLGAVVHGRDHPARLREALDGAFPRLLALKAQGAIGAIGLGVNEHAIADEVMGHVDLDVVLLAGRHTLLDRSAEQAGFLDRCHARRTSIVVGGVFNSGILADPFGVVPRFNYKLAPPALLAQAKAMARACGEAGVPLGAAAVQFAINHPAVASLLIGARSAAQLSEAIGWAQLDLPPTLLVDLDAIAAA